MAKEKRDCFYCKWSPLESWKMTKHAKPRPVANAFGKCSCPAPVVPASISRAYGYYPPAPLRNTFREYAEDCPCWAERE